MTISDDLILFNPKHKRKSPADRVPTLKRSVLSKIGSPGKSKNAGGSRKGWKGKAAAHVKKPIGFSRRVVVKARIVKATAYGKKANALHIRYIEREGVEKDGSKGQLYGKDQDFERDQFLRDLPDEPHQFRFIVSPEDGAELDMTEYTRQLMSQIEKDLGRGLKWAAVNHFNTDNPHTHIVVRGLDLEGQSVFIDREYISNGIRNRACEIATKELGLRTLHDLQNQQRREISQERFTSLDRIILQRLKEGVFEFPNPNEPALKVDRHILIGRLQTLQRMGLAHHYDMKWEMAEEWETTLRKMGERADIIKNLHQAIGHKEPNLHLVDKEGAIQPITGRVLYKGLSNELYDSYYAVIESPKGESYHIELDKGTKPELLQEGHIVTIEREAVSRKRSTDSIIANVASGHDGIYSRIQHEQDLAGESNKEKLLDAISLRLGSLNRMQLANQLETGVWRVRADFMEQLEELDKQKPDFKMKITPHTLLRFDQQAKHKGETWLDQFIGGIGEDIARFGFGAKLRQGVEDRKEFLQQLGINPSSEERRQSLQEFERIELGEQLSRKTGANFIPQSIGEWMQGKIGETQPGASGQKYMKVENEAEQKFTLIPWRKDLDKMRGRQIAVLWNQESKLFVKKRDMDIGQ